VSKLFKASLLLTFFFGINKLVALLRQGLIAKQFGFSPEMDAFNVANNLPDLLFSLISGGALAVAFIPVLSDYLEKKGYHHSWRLFSIVANLVFLVTAGLSLVVALFAHQLIISPFGIAPGFSPVQQLLATDLMRLNLIATLIFSLSGLVMAGLQSHKHFLLPAIAPILYNAGIIFGSVFLVPFFGVYGLVYGVIIGAILHLGIQIPGLIKYHFKWSASFDLKEPGVRQTLRLMGPRILTVLFIQIIFLSRDNLASRLAEGSVTALTYAYFIMQVPETLIGTAIATALLPTLSSLIAADKKDQFVRLMNNTINIILGLTVFTAVILSISLEYLIEPVFGFNPSEISLLVWTTRAYLVGLVGQCLLEVVTRAYYAQKNAHTPLVATCIRMIVFLGLAVILVNPLNAAGLALADSLTITLEVGILLYLMRRSSLDFLHPSQTVIRVGLGSILVAAIMWGILIISPLPHLITILIAMFLGGLIGLWFIRQELKTLLRL
jgi:putative peptidoglycan lipid II flippase